MNVCTNVYFIWNILLWFYGGDYDGHATTFPPTYTIHITVYLYTMRYMNINERKRTNARTIIL